MADIRDKLKDLLGKPGLMTGAEWQSRLKATANMAQPPRHKATANVTQPPSVVSHPGGEFEIDTVVPGEVVGGPDDCFYLVRQDFSLDDRHGNVPLGAVLEAIPEHIALSACDVELEEFDPTTTLFIDVETTGLAGGTGTVALLVGVGYFTEGVFRLEQCFMRDYDEEEAMLRYLDGVFRGCETVVSYNGKSFDVPLLRTRFIANRMPFGLDSAMHFDLVHAARRFWKKRLGDCSLGNIERAILGLERHGDVPSSEVPQIWFDYLYSRDASQLERVFYHHKMDILSLVGLTALLSQCLDVPKGQGFEHAEDRLSLIRLHFRQNRFEDVVTHARDLLETETAEPVCRECLELLAYAQKRLQDWDHMEETWGLLLQKFPKDLIARIELAKHYEHRKRDLPAAERLCEETIQFLETRTALGHDTELDIWYTESFRHRIDRIRRRLSKC